MDSEQLEKWESGQLEKVDSWTVGESGQLDSWRKWTVGEMEPMEPKSGQWRNGAESGQLVSELVLVLLRTH